MGTLRSLPELLANIQPQDAIFGADDGAAVILFFCLKNPAEVCPRLSSLR